MNVSFEVFENVPLLTWLPDETLFSLVSRHHRWWGRSLSRQTNIILFGHHQGGSQHDFPSCVDEFARRTATQFGDAPAICAHRTLLHYYRKFLNDSEEASLIEKMRGPTVANLKFQLGILTSRFRSNHPLKACMSCMKSDRQNYGWTYWHIAHQYPGVWFCPLHKESLYESNFKSTGVGRFEWYLPSESHLLHPLGRDRQACPLRTNIFNRLGDLSIQIIDDRPGKRIDIEKLHWLYRSALRKRDLLTKNGGLKLTSIAKDYLAHIQPLKLYPEFSALPNTVDEALNQLSRILRFPRTGTHPLRHFVIIEWLFRDADEFLREYQVISSNHDVFDINTPALQGDLLIADAEVDVRKERLGILIRGEGKSMRAAAALVGIDTATAIVWASQMRIGTLRRPKKLSADVRMDLIDQLKMGVDKAVLAERFNISGVTVTSVLRSEFGLSETWHQVRFRAEQSKSRSAWLKLVEEHAALGVKFIRHLNPGVYAWLYRNDRVWLQAQSPHRGKSNIVNEPRVRWDDRDLVLCAEVERVALEIRPTLGKHKLMLWHLYQVMPELKAKLSALNRLPLTVRAIETALGRQIRKKGDVDMLE